MLKLVQKLSSRPKPARKPKIVRRAVLLCMHPHFGLSVLDREKLFKNLIGQFTDECRRSNQDLQKLAESTLRSRFQERLSNIERGEMFALSGLTPGRACRTECTPFFFTLYVPGGYSAVPLEAYRPVPGHPSAAAILRSVSSIELAQETPLRRVRGLG